MTESAVAGNRTKTGIRKVAPWFSRVVMLPPAFVFTVITLRYFRDPGHAIAGMSLRSPEAFTDTRVIGAWMLTLLVLLMTFFVSKQRLWLGNLQLAVFMGATLALRARWHDSGDGQSTPYHHRRDRLPGAKLRRPAPANQSA